MHNKTETVIIFITHMSRSVHDSVPDCDKMGGLAVVMFTAVVLSHRHMLTILILFLVEWALFLFLWDPW